MREACHDYTLHCNEDEVKRNAVRDLQYIAADFAPYLTLEGAQSEKLQELEENLVKFRQLEMHMRYRYYIRHVNACSGIIGLYDGDVGVTFTGSAYIVNLGRQMTDELAGYNGLPCATEKRLATALMVHKAAKKLGYNGTKMIAAIESYTVHGAMHDTTMERLESCELRDLAEQLCSDRCELMAIYPTRMEHYRRLVLCVIDSLIRRWYEVGLFPLTPMHWNLTTRLTDDCDYARWGRNTPDRLDFIRPAAREMVDQLEEWQDEREGWVCMGGYHNYKSEREDVLEDERFRMDRAQRLQWLMDTAKQACENRPESRYAVDLYQDTDDLLMGLGLA